MGEWRAHQRDRPTLRHEIYRVGQKRGHKLMTLILSILNRLKYFTRRFLGKFAVK